MKRGEIYNTDKYLYDIHENLIRNKGLKTYHFDYFSGHLLDSLEPTFRTSKCIVDEIKGLRYFGDRK